MTPAEVSDLFGLIRQYDNRDVPDDAKVLAWWEILADLEATDCAAAVKKHFRESTDYLLPAHVRSGALEAVKRRAAQRRAASLGQSLPEGERATPALAIEAGSAGRPQWRSGTDQRSPHAAALIAEIRKKLPPSRGNPNWVDPEFRRNRTPRAAGAGPNPDFAGWRLGDILDDLKGSQP